MSTGTEDQIDEARSALVSDIHELKTAGDDALASAQSKLPWLVAGAVGLVTLGAVVHWVRPQRRSLFGIPQRSRGGNMLRAAALSATSFVLHRYLERAVNQLLPEQ